MATDSRSTRSNTTSRSTNNKNTGSRSSDSGTKTTRTGSTNTRKPKKPENNGVYFLVSIVFNLLFGLMGLGIGFLFFLASALTSGTTVYSILIFLCGAVAIALYLFCLVKLNKVWVYVCSDKKTKSVDRNRMIFSLTFSIIILIISFAYSFLRSAL